MFLVVWLIASLFWMRRYLRKDVMFPCMTNGTAKTARVARIPATMRLYPPEKQSKNTRRGKSITAVGFARYANVKHMPQRNQCFEADTITKAKRKNVRSASVCPHCNSASETGLKRYTADAIRPSRQNPKRRKKKKSNKPTPVSASIAIILMYGNVARRSSGNLELDIVRSR